MLKLIKNRCQCNVCNDIIESKHGHDWVSCKCGAIFTDGGLNYVRRGYKKQDNITDLSEYIEYRAFLPARHIIPNK